MSEKRKRTDIDTRFFNLTKVRKRMSSGILLRYGIHRIPISKRFVRNIIDPTNLKSLTKFNSYFLKPT